MCSSYEKLHKDYLPLPPARQCSGILLHRLEIMVLKRLYIDNTDDRRGGVKSIVLTIAQQEPVSFGKLCSARLTGFTKSIPANKKH